jgi:hypothetical protein
MDPNFGATADFTVNCLSAQPDQSVTVGGAFTNISGSKHTALARLILISGIPDINLDVMAEASTNAATVNAVINSPDGKILFGGKFTKILSTTCFGAASRLLPRLTPPSTAGRRMFRKQSSH